jgi:hypothetical protein
MIVSGFMAEIAAKSAHDHEISARVRRERENWAL